ncbi:hypothetical protein AALP_AA5G224600 [Arabis alpina]|uniref:J domain-containing protein n=1 Tax=Arabis alpina TaxID=50452 RepID=A0A087GYS6_ARAAL|nr:hypothetical protein AALP_AA5G224600 [Arabis alpina]
MMIAAIRAAILKPQDHSSHLKTVFFHSSPILQRKHQSNSKARDKRLERKKAKQDLRRNVNAFAHHLFGYSRVSKRNRNVRHIPPNLDKRCFDFDGVDDGFEAEYFIRTALGGSWGFSYEEKKARGRGARGFSGSNTTYEEEGEARSWRYSNNFKRSWGSRYRLDEEEEEDRYSSSELNDTESDQESQRQTLGLSSSGPLNIEDVKNAYRACALKWHPDRHHDSTKNAAEEKFKLCTMAYQSLCEKLAIN